MSPIPAVVPPLPRARSWNRNVAPAAAFDWLRAGWRDFTIDPAASISYGLLVFLVSVVTTVGLFALRWDFILLPAFAGFMVVGPIIGIGLYEKSRRIAEGRPVGLWQMVFVRPESGGQVLFAGVLLFLLTLLWMRAAVIVYALFFGIAGNSFSSGEFIHSPYHRGRVCGKHSASCPLCWMQRSTAV